jgi:hypothetical protein
MEDAFEQRLRALRPELIDWIRRIDRYLAVGAEERKRSVVLKPCTGCGNCCRSWTCSLGFIIYGTHYDCPSLVQVEGRWRCQEVINHPELKELLSIGNGCGTLRRDQFPSPPGHGT